MCSLFWHSSPWCGFGRYRQSGLLCWGCLLCRCSCFFYDACPSAASQCSHYVILHGEADSHTWCESWPRVQFWWCKVCSIWRSRRRSGSGIAESGSSYRFLPWSCDPEFLGQHGSKYHGLLYWFQKSDGLGPWVGPASARLGGTAPPKRSCQECLRGALAEVFRVGSQFKLGFHWEFEWSQSSLWSDGSPCSFEYSNQRSWWRGHWT